MARGDFSRKVRLRKRDFLKSEAERVNAIPDRLNADGEKLKANLDQLEASLTQLATGNRAAEMDACLQAITACRTILASREEAAGIESLRE